MLYRRFSGAIVAVSSKLTSSLSASAGTTSRFPTRALCGADSPSSCTGLSSGVLSALLQLSAAHAKAPPVAEHPTRGVKTAVPGQGDDSTKSALNPSTLRYPTPDRIVAIGDVHGDFEALRGLLRRSKLLGMNNEWVGGKTVLVQVGDQLDRGDGERNIYDLLFKLQDTAPKTGGQVHILLGNHELMNFNMDFRYVTEGGFADFIRPKFPFGKGTAVPKPFQSLIRSLPPPMRARAAALAPGGPLTKQLAQRAKVSVIVGDTVFVHAGLQPAHFGISAANKDDNLGSSFASKALRKINLDTREFLLGKRDHLPTILEGAGGPVWMRTYSRRGVRAGGAECQLLNDTLKLLGAKRMVVGHTVQPAINAACGGRVWRVDTGLSSAYGGPAEALEILRGGRTQVVTQRGTVDGKSRSF